VNNKKQCSKWKLYLVIAICAAPLLLAYLTYYVLQPSSRTNYGTLLDPRLYPMPKLHSVLQGGDPKELTAYRGKWMMLQVSVADCQTACRNGLFAMRQLRLMQGKDRDRIERVLLIRDQASMETSLIREYDDMPILRVDAKLLDAWLPVEEGASLEDRLYLIDPLGNLIMRYPVDADPKKINKDIVKLLKASSIG
jgi:cytochrome oxidase Cu insertion factor (SCO1/SenC/PrrC family)